MSYLSVAHAAHALDVSWPEIRDPFSTQKKIAPYGENLKPANCPPLPDISKPVDLQSVVIATICHNPDSRAAYLSLLASADNYDGTIMSFLPDITASANGSRSALRNDGTNSISRGSGVSASTSLTLFDFGRRETQLDVAERTLVAAGLSYDSTLQGFIAQSLQAYFSLINSQNSLEIARESFDLSRAALDAAETRYGLGLVPLSDVLQARASTSQSELSLQQAENNLVNDRTTLAQLMGLPTLSELTAAEMDDSNILDAPFSEGVVRLIEDAKAQRVDLKASRLQLQNAEDSLRLTQKRALPSISLNASTGYDDWDVVNNDTRRSDVVGVSVSIPIFTGFGRVFSERAQKKQLEQQREQLTRTELNVEKEVLNSWQNYNTSVQSYATSYDSLATATKLNEVTLGRYKEGLGTILDVLSAQNSYRGALQSNQNARFNLLTSRLNLVRAVGILDLNNATPTPAPVASSGAPTVKETP